MQGGDVAIFRPRVFVGARQGAERAGVRRKGKGCCGSSAGRTVRRGRGAGCIQAADGCTEEEDKNRCGTPAQGGARFPPRLWSSQRLRQLWLLGQRLCAQLRAAKGIARLVLVMPVRSVTL